MNNSMKRIVMLFLIMSSCLIGCSRTVDKPCDWCGNEPSVVYKNSDGDESYVCKKCSSTCMICGDEDPKYQTENLLGMVMFICEDCYNEDK